jgi:uncharacterized phage protein (TIGR02216 family)
MALGFGILRMEPKAFWQLTLRELSAAATVVVRGHSHSRDRPGRADLATLMTRYPDQPQEQ